MTIRMFSARTCGRCLTELEYSGECPKCRQWKHENEVADLRAALEAVEWLYDDGAYLLCPWCMNTKRQGHAADCQRQLALGGNNDNKTLES